jgi:hypothetical protein
MGQPRAQPVAQHGLQPVDVDPVGVQLDRVDVGAAAAQVQQCPVVGRRLDHHGVARRHQRLEQERVGLHGAVGDQHLVDLDAVMLGDPLAQRHVADGGAVGRRSRRIALEGGLCGLAQALGVHDVERGGAAGEGDRVGHGARIRALPAAPLRRAAKVGARCTSGARF